MTAGPRSYRVKDEPHGRRLRGKALKKETLITAAVFLIVGFLAGNFYRGQKDASMPAPAAATSPTTGLPPGHPPTNSDATAQLPPGHPPIDQQDTSVNGLPPGHPPINADAVIQEMKTQIGQNPGNSQMTVQLANFLYDQHQFARAIKWYKRALAIDPKDVNARTDMGTSYFMTGNPQEALKEYQHSLAIDPTHKPTMFDTIIVNLEGTQDLTAARKAWKRLDAFDPGYPGLDKLKQAIDAAAQTSRGASNPH